MLRNGNFFSWLGGVLLAVVVVGVIVLYIGFHRIKPDAGFEMVLVKKPIFSMFDNGGVVDKPVATGSVWAARTTEGFPYPTTPFTKEVNFNDMMTSTKSLVDFKTHIRFEVLDSVKLHKDFGKRWFEDNIDPNYQNFIRNENRARTPDQLYDPKELGKIETAAADYLNKFMLSIKMPVRAKAVIIGKVSPNQAVLDEIDRTAAQQQRSATEITRRKAEEDRKAAEIAAAAADNAYRERMSLSPEQFIEKTAIEAYLASVKECAKNPNCTIVISPPGQQMTLPAKR